MNNSIPQQDWIKIMLTLFKSSTGVHPSSDINRDIELSYFYWLISSCIVAHK